MIYFDHNATTIMHPEVVKLMTELMQEALNPSATHANGRKAKAIIENARQKILSLVNVDTKDFTVVFTSGGTESNNLILNNFKDADIFIATTEHVSILLLKNYLPNIHLINVDKNGIINLEEFEASLRNSNNSKKLVSVMLANNETGVIQPLKEISNIAKKYNSLIHSDLVQAVGKINVDMEEYDLDFATISAHKFGGALGAGALIARQRFHLTPMIIGGGQEKNIRSGTENVLAIAALGKAAELAKDEYEHRHNKMRQLQMRLEQNLHSQFEVVAENTLRLPNTSLLIAQGFLAEVLLINFDLKGIMISSGSACSSGKVSKSHVLSAMGFGQEQIKSAIRISLSHYNTEDEVDSFIKACRELFDQKGVA